MSVAWVAVGAAVVGTVASSASASKATKAQQGIANQAASDNRDALAEQTRQADELLAFNKTVYEENKTRQVGIDQITNKVVQQNLDLSQKAEDRADDSYNFYKTVGRPAVQKSIEEAGNFDSADNIAAARGRATADVEQGFANADQQSQTALTRLGINPSSGRFMALQQRLQADKAAALAGAATGAEDQRRTQAIGLRQQASNLAQGFPAQTTADGGQSSGTANSAAAAAGASGTQNLAVAQQALNGMATGASIYGNVAAGNNQLYQSANNNINAINTQAANAQAGWGSLAGTALNIATRKANGGKVEGPGTGTSDSVPAVNTSTGGPVRLSNGEYVISADTVRAKGTKFFDDLQAKHHKHVNMGRATA